MNKTIFGLVQLSSHQNNLLKQIYNFIKLNALIYNFNSSNLSKCVTTFLLLI